MRVTPYLAYAKKSFLRRTAYRFDHIIAILNDCLQIFIFWGIYKALYGSNTEIDGITMTMVTTNFILSRGLGIIFCVDDYFLPSKIFDGTIANELLRPISFKGRLVAENVGNALFNVIFCFLPVFIIAVFFIGISQPASVFMFTLFIISAVLGYGVLWSISFAAQMTSFWLVNIWSLITIKNAFINVLSGAMIPLWFMPKWIFGALKFTPFASIYFTPIQIYLGQLTYEEIVIKFLIQVVWIVLIYLLGNLLWIKGQKKLVVQGG